MAGDAIGTVQALTGAAMVRGADGKIRQLAEGDPVYEGDVLLTDQFGALTIELSDGTPLTVGADSQLTLDQATLDAARDAAVAEDEADTDEQYGDEGEAEVSIGTVSDTVGQVYVEAPDGTLRELSAGDQVFLGETLVTEDRSSIDIDFEGGRTASFSSNTRLLLDEDYARGMGIELSGQRGNVDSGVDSTGLLQEFDGLKQETLGDGKESSASDSAQASPETAEQPGPESEPSRGEEGKNQTSSSASPDGSGSEASRETSSQAPASSEPKTTSSAEPQTTSSAEPQTTSSAEPQTTSSAEPQTTSSAEPQTTSSAEPQTTSSAEPQPTSSAEPQATSSSEPQTTSSSEPQTTSSSEPQTTSSSEPQTTSSSEPQTTSSSEPQPTVASGTDTAGASRSGTPGSDQVQTLTQAPNTQATPSDQQPADQESNFEQDQGDPQTARTGARSSNPTSVARPEPLVAENGDRSSYFAAQDNYATQPISPSFDEPVQTDVQREDAGVSSFNDAPENIGITKNRIDENDASNIGQLTGRDPEGGALTYRLKPGTGNNAEFEIGPDNTLSAPNGLDYESGAERTVIVEAIDPAGNVTEQTFTILVNDLNEAPVAKPDSATTNEDTPVTIDAVQNDSDVDGDPLTITGVSAPAHGTVAINDDNTLTYTPAENYNGDDEFTYIVSDGEYSATETVSVAVTPVNDAPEVQLEELDFTGPQEDGVPQSFAYGATDVDGDTLTYEILAQPEEGRVKDNGDGTFTFDPGADFQDLAAEETRDVSFSYMVADGQGGMDTGLATITITGTNDAPTVEATTSSAKEDDADYTISTAALLASSSDPDASDTLSVENTKLSSGDASGVTVNGDGSLSVSPAAYNALATGESEVIEYTYDVVERDDAGTELSHTPTTATTTITGTNDAPSIGVTTSTANEDDADYNISTADLLASSSDPDASDSLSVENTTLSSGDGSGITVNEDGSLSITPATYNALASGESSVIEYTYDVVEKDDAGTELSRTQTTATITIEGTNDAPSIGVTTSTANEDDADYTISTADLLASSSDPDATDTLTVENTTLSSGDASGVTVNEDGSLSVTPSTYNALATGESEVIEYTYDLVERDDAGNELSRSPTTATITITGTNDAPSIGVTTSTANEDDADYNISTADLLASSSDPDASDSLSVENTTLSSGDGSGITVNEDGSLSITPATYNALASGESSVIEYAYDVVEKNDAGAELSRTQTTATITITGTNDAPSIGVTTSTATEDDADYTISTADLLTSSSDPDASDTLSVENTTLSSGDASGVTVNGDGSLSVSPTTYNALASGESSVIEYTYDVVEKNDAGAELSRTQTTATITITGTNDAPSIGVTTSTATEDDADYTISTAALLASSSDPDASDSLSVQNTTLSSGDASGVTVNGDGSLSVTPATYNALASGESSVIEYNYDVVEKDDAGTELSRTQTTATITIEGTNDAPSIGVTTSTATEDDADYIISTADLLASSSDPDASDSLSVENTTLSSGDASGVTVNEDGSLSVIPSTYNALASGESSVIEYNYDVVEKDDAGTELSRTQTTATITITGTNDAPSIGVTTSTANEDDADYTISTADLLASSSDPDASDSLSVENTAFSSGDASGITVNTDGSLSVTPSAYNALASGESEVIEYTYDVVEKDDAGAEISRTQTTATITITGTNDQPVVQDVTVSDPITEDDASYAGNLSSVTDADTTDLHTYALDQGPAVGQGSVTVDPGGSFTFTPGTDFQDLGAGENETVTFTYTATDDSDAANATSVAKTVTLTITGTNDAAVISVADGDSAIGAVTEDDAATLTDSGTLTITDTDAGDGFRAETLSNDGGYGSLAIDADGNWTYTADNTQTAIQELSGPVGEQPADTLTETFTVTSLDGSDTQDIVVTITGTNDAAVISVADGDSATGAVTEDDAATLTDSGTLTVTDTDAGEGFRAKTLSNDGGYGSLAIDPDGNWTYTADNTQTAIQQLSGPVGEQPADTLTETFTVTSLDGSDTQDIVVTITGTNDAAVISVADGDSATGAITEDDAATLTDSGTLTVTDTDAGEGFRAETLSNDGGYGSLAINADGNWTYTADNTQTAIQELSGPVGEQPADTLTETFTVTSLDGSDTQDIVVTITGTNDAAVISVADGDSATGAVTEDDAATLTDSGTLTVTDTDAGEGFRAETLSNDGGYGSLAINADGNWTYTADNTQTAIQELSGPVGEQPADTLTETFTVTSLDGSDTQDIVVTITGTNDAAVISVADGDSATGAVTEDDAATLTDSGTLTVTDTDAGEGFRAETLSNDGGYGSLAIDPDGNWTYTADNTQTAIQELSGPVGEQPADTLTETFTVTSLDGSDTQDIVVTITGTNDAPVSNADTNSGFEGLDPTAAAAIEGNVLDNDTDVDNARSEFTVINAGAGSTASAFTDSAILTGTYGKLTINTDGSYSYQIADTNPEVNGLIENESLTDVFTYEMSDNQTGSALTDSATLTIEILGTNDGVDITDSSVKVYESGLAARGEEPEGSTSASDPSEPITQTGSFSITAPDGVETVKVGGVDIIADGNLIDNVKVPTTYGALSEFGYDADSGVVTYTYTLSDNATHASPEQNEFVDNIPITLTDRDESTSTGSLAVTIIDDVPVANPDTDADLLTSANSNTSGNVITGETIDSGSGATLTETGQADRVGADGATVTNVVSLFEPSDSGGSTSTGSGTEAPADSTAATAALTSLPDVLTGATTAIVTDPTTAETEVRSALESSATAIADSGNVLSQDGNEAAGKALALASSALNYGTDLDCNDPLEFATTITPVLTSVSGNPATADEGLAPTTLRALEESAASTDGSLDPATQADILIQSFDVIATSLPTLEPDQQVLLLEDVASAMPAFSELVAEADPATAAEIEVARANLQSAISESSSGQDPLVQDSGQQANDAIDLLFGTDSSGTGGTTSPEPPPTDPGAMIVEGKYGALTVQPDGTYKYEFDPGNANFLALGETVDTEVFTYTLTDGDGDTASTTLTIRVEGTNDAPVAQDDRATLDTTQALELAPADQQTLSVDIGTAPLPSANGGSVTYDEASGSFSYTAADGFSGVDTFEYTVRDSSTNETVTQSVAVYVPDPTVETATSTLLGSTLVADAGALEFNAVDYLLSETAEYTWTTSITGNVIDGTGDSRGADRGTDTDPDLNDTLSITSIKALGDPSLETAPKSVLDQVASTAAATTDGPATVSYSISGPEVVTEGDSSVATFTVTQTGDLQTIFGLADPTPVQISYRTVDGTAIAGPDYTHIEDVLIFDGSQTSQTFSVIINSDEVAEFTESFSALIEITPEDLTAALPNIPVITESMATVNIQDDDNTDQPVQPNTQEGTPSETSIEGQYGTLNIQQSGDYTYTLNAAGEAKAQASDLCDVFYDEFEYTVNDRADGSGLTDTATLRVAIQGAGFEVLSDTPLTTTVEDTPRIITSTEILANEDVLKHIQQDGKVGVIRDINADPQYGSVTEYDLGTGIVSGVSDQAWEYTPALDLNGENIPLRVTIEYVDATSGIPILDQNGQPEIRIINALIDIEPGVTEGASHSTQSTTTGQFMLPADEIVDPVLSDRTVTFDAAPTFTTGPLYGELDLATDGSWTYTLDNENTVVDALPEGASLVETILVSDSEGTPRTITIHIKGTNDAPVAEHVNTLPKLVTVATPTIEVTDAELLAFSSDIDATDVTLEVVAVRAATALAGEPNLEKNPAGNWVYAPPDGETSVAFNFIVKDPNGGYTNAVAIAEIVSTLPTTLPAVGVVSGDPLAATAENFIDIPLTDSDEHHVIRLHDTGAKDVFSISGFDPTEKVVQTDNPVRPVLQAPDTLNLHDLLDSGGDGTSPTFDEFLSTASTEELVAELAGRMDISETHYSADGTEFLDVKISILAPDDPTTEIDTIWIHDIDINAISGVETAVEENTVVTGKDEVKIIQGMLEKGTLDVSPSVEILDAVAPVVDTGTTLTEGGPSLGIT